MRVHRIRLTNFRGVADSAVEFPESGVTIVEGPNEVGKSSIAEALDMVLSTLDSSASRSVRATQPVHLDVGTRVEIEMSTGNYRFILAKQWHRDRRTELEILSPVREQLRGREAHERVQRMLSETLDRDLWDALRLSQGDGLAAVAFDVPALGRALDAAAGGELVGDREGDLWERICGERERYWTPTGLPRAERTALVTRVAEARSEVDDAAAQLAALATATDEVARLTVQARQIEASQADLSRSHDALVERSAQIAARRGELGALASEEAAARQTRDSAREAVERRVGIRHDVERQRQLVHSLAADLDARIPEIEAFVAQDASLRGQLHAAHMAVDEAEAVHRRAIGDRDYRRQQIELEQLTERRNRVQAAEIAIAGADETLERVIVDDDMAERIEAAELNVAAADAAAAASGATVKVTAIGAVTITVDDLDIELTPGQSADLTVGEAARLAVPGVVQFDVRAGLDARVFSDQARVARDDYDKLCREAGVANRAEARTQANSRREAARDRAEAATTIERDLRDLTLDLISSKVTGLARRIAVYEAERGTEPALPVDLAEAQSRAATSEREVTTARDRLTRLELQAGGAADMLRDLQLAHAGLAARAEQVQAGLASTIDLLESSRADRSDLQLEAAAIASDERLQAAVSALGSAEQRLAEHDPVSVALLLDNARAACDRATDELAACRDRIRELQMLLDIRGEQGLQQSHDEALTRLDHLQRELRRAEARADAAALLYDTFAQRRADARQRYVAPFRDRIEQLGRVVFGPSFAVELSEDLGVGTRTLNGITLDVDQLSVGAREQLGILSRLACAAIVSDEGGAPVILDDAMGWTDPGRLDTMGAAIALAGRNCQVIVLTCTPGRYASVGSASVITLDA